MSDLTKARLKTFFVLALVIELVVLGMAFFYRGIMNDTLRSKVMDFSKQILVQANDSVKQQLTKIEGVTQQLFLDASFRANISEIQLGTLDGISEKIKVKNVRDQLTGMKYLDPNIVGIRLYSRNNFQLEAVKLTKYLMSNPLMPYISTAINKQGMQDFSDADGKVVWIPTLAKGFFNDPSIDSIKDFPGYTLTLGRVLKDVQHPDADMTVVVEVNSKIIQDTLKNVKIGKESKMYITDDQNKIIYSPDLTKIATASEYAAPSGTSEIVFEDDSKMVMRLPIEGMKWYTNIEYSKAEYMEYLQTVFVAMVVGITLLVLIISFALAWIMNRPYDEDSEQSYAA